MGLISGFKSFKNFVTGGSAKVSVAWADPQLHEPFTVTVTAEIGDAPVKIKRVYLEIEGREEILVPNHEVVFRINEQEHRNIQDITRNHCAMQLLYDIAGEQELAANETYAWHFDVSFPENAQPPFQGSFSRYSYRIFAGLDTFGNDPDSGWVALV